MPRTPAGEGRPDVSVLVVGYRSMKYLEACLGGAMRSVGALRAEILYLDCSNDGSIDFVRARFPQVRVLPFAGNLGFGRGNNLLAQHAAGEFMLLLNPDTAPRADEIERLVAFARARRHAGAWGGRTVTPDGRPDTGSHQVMISAWRALLTLVGLRTLGAGSLPIGATRPQRVPVVSGAFLLVDAALWRELGGFDELFFMYAEEVDLCRRIQGAGREIWADPSIAMEHDLGSGNPHDPKRAISTIRGNATFFHKHHGPVAATIGCAASYLHEARRLLQAATLDRLRNPADAKARAAKSRAVLAARRQWWNGWPPGMRFE